MVCEPLAIGSQTKCAYAWTGLRTCAAPSVNGSQTIRCEPKFVIFCANTKRTGCTGSPFHALYILCSPQVRGKLINGVPNTRCMRMAQRVSDALVYTKLYTTGVINNLM